MPPATNGQSPWEARFRDAPGGAARAAGEDVKKNAAPKGGAAYF